MTTNIPLPTRLLVLRRAEYCCEDCGQAAGRSEGTFPGGLDLHHVVRPEDGGTHDLENLAALCESCHYRRHRGTRRRGACEWLMELVERRLGDDIRNLIQEAYQRTGTLSGTARALGVSRPTLAAWLEDLGGAPISMIEFEEREDRQPVEAGAL